MNSTSNWGRSGPGAEPDEDPRLVRAAQEYLTAMESGQRPDRGEFAARHADLFPALATYLDAVDLLHGAPPLRPPLAATPEPTALGDFRIVGEIGRGGMGVVYEAVQLSLGRRVALKVLPFAATLDAKQLQRFQNEAQAAAHLHHTNIVPVYAVGCERGVHYYAMQLIEGQNLSDLIRDLRQLRGGSPEVVPPRPATMPTQPTLADALTTRRTTRAGAFFHTAARLAVQAAEALEHAHQLGVIHRDIKPANLLVDGRGNLWVTDFGLAQFHTGGNLTRTGDLLGTLHYMSPEQAGGQRVAIDARIDVYSLGATLYELLTLTPLFTAEDHPTLLRQILNEEPRSPRSLDRSLPAELETIVLKAVSKNPADRYATAREFADDLGCFLENRPIRARRPTATQRVKKWAQRHPSFVVASLVVLALLSAGSLVSTAVVHGEQAKTEAAYKSERQRADEAEERFRLAQRSVDELFQLSEEELANKPGTERLRKRILESVLAYYREFIDQRRDDPKAQADLRETERLVEAIVADLTVLQANSQLDLLGQAAVLDDLDLSPKLRARVKELTARLGKQRTEWFESFRHPVPPDEMRKRALDQARANNADVKKILGAAQLARLAQIALQQQGPGALREPDVAAALKLKSEQREDIRRIDEKLSFASMQEWNRPGGGSDDSRKTYEERRAKALTDMLAVLSPDQAHQWKKMTGEPFKGPTPLFLPFFPGSAPGPPPGGSKGPRPETH